MQSSWKKVLKFALLGNCFCILSTKVKLLKGSQVYFRPFFWKDKVKYSLNITVFNKFN